MAALEARSLLTRETIPSPDARYPNRVGGIVRMMGGLRLEWWAPSRQNGGRHQIGIGGRLTSESAYEATGLPIGRPWVTCFIDRHTREIPGFHIGFDAAGTYPLMEALKVAIAPKAELLAEAGETGQWPCMGTPRVLMCDQGREFKSKSFVLACLMLGIHVRYAPVLRAWCKGKVERFFRTLATDVFHRVPSRIYPIPRVGCSTPRRPPVAGLQLRHHLPDAGELGRAALVMRHSVTEAFERYPGESPAYVLCGQHNQPG